MPQKNVTNFLAAVFFGTFLSKCKYFEVRLTKCWDFLHLGVFEGGEPESAKIFQNARAHADLRTRRKTVITHLSKHILSWFLVNKYIYHRCTTYPKNFRKVSDPYGDIRIFCSAFCISQKCFIFGYYVQLVILNNISKN